MALASPQPIVKKVPVNNTQAPKATPIVNTTTPNPSSLYLDYSCCEDDDRKASSAKEAAFGLQSANNNLYDGRIMDNAGLVESNLINNEDWRVDVANEEGELESTKLVDAILQSFDSPLDLYIENIVNGIIETYGATCCYNLRAIFGSPDSAAIKELAKLGIRADAVGDHDNWQNRTYTFSLIDMSGVSDDMTDEEIVAYVYGDDAKILEDEQGHKGSMIFADCLTADGTAQGAELNLSSILDEMGYECVSKADFANNPEAYQEMLDKIQQGLASGAFKSSGETINDMYGETLKMYEAVCAVYNINGDAPGQWGRRLTFEQTKAAIERAGASLFCGGRAQKGDAIKYGKFSSMSDFESLDKNGDGVLDKSETKSLREESLEADKAKKEKAAKEKAAKETQAAQDSAKAQELLEQEYTENLEDATDMVEEMMEENPEMTEEEIIRMVAKEEGVDRHDLALSL